MILQGKKAFVTGGSGDTGAVIAQALAEEGADVAVSYVGEKGRADETVKAIKNSGLKGYAVQLDQRDPSSIDAAVNEIEQSFGGLDILVNNAAWNIGIPFPDLDALNLDIWDRIQETNLRGPYLLSRAFAKLLKADGGGAIVNISSVGGLTPGSSSIAYSVSKAGLNHLTRCLAVAMGPDVTVNCICPGLIEGTRMAANVPEPMVEGARQMAALNRASDIDDIARQTVTYCLAKSVTGQVIAIDGGLPQGMK